MQRLPPPDLRNACLTNSGLCVYQTSTSKLSSYFVATEYRVRWPFYRNRKENISLQSTHESRSTAISKKFTEWRKQDDRTEQDKDQHAMCIVLRYNGYKSFMPARRLLITMLS